MTNFLVFDIETVPDTHSGARLLELEDLSPAEITSAMVADRRQRGSLSDFLPLPLQQVVCISIVLQTASQIKVCSLGEVDADEKDLVNRFFAGINKYSPILVSWNGAGFDLPVLHYRALLHGITARRYWDTGDLDKDFRWNNYLNRYHYRHMDLMDILSGYQARGSARLDDIATMLGLPGKMGMEGSQVARAYQQGDIVGIRNYCETDVLNTYLILLRFQLMRGELSINDYQQHCQQLREYLITENKPHLHAFNAAWQEQTL